MKALILVGGEGTRLRPLTCNRPKSVVPIINKPFLEHLLDYLKQHGITEVILAMGYLPDPIQNCLGDGSRSGITIRYNVEDLPLGTAGAVKNAETFLDDTFLVFNGDIVTEIDLSEMIRRHKEVKPRASIALTPVDNPTIYGVVETDDHGMVKRFIEKPSRDEVTTNMINAGIYILEPDVLKRIPAGVKFMFEHDVFPAMLKENEPILSYSSDAYWIDIGTPDKYIKVHHDLLLKHGSKYFSGNGNNPIYQSARIKEPVLIAAGCIIAEDVVIQGPAVIGAGCKIDKGVVIDGGILWDGVKVGAGSVLTKCIIGSDTVIQENCFIPAGCVLGEKVRLDKGSKLAEGTKVEPNTRITEQQ